ncbi:MAG: hypothetical protein A3C53_05870 [Omnitrophica WOR_2 bacterium RIFCSPHIGHO2_02_FULL_68_15]|nr:MAG: hypothetical protein A3C53_05870 [Omnitrophica WOR_2 bacterium RIFCSPHIGHO2_02_FULL_68_15]
MRNIRLTRQEREIEAALLRGEYVDVPKAEFEAIAKAIAHRRKDAVLNIRVNREDVESIKQKARQLGVRYQALLSEFIHRLAHA